MSARLGHAAVSYVTYLGQLFYPAGLAAFYPHPGRVEPWPTVLGAVVTLTLISAVILLLWRKCPYLLVGWFWYLGMLVPSIGLVQIGLHGRADRYTYLPQIGAYLALVWAAAHAARAVRCPGWARAAVASLVLAALTVCAWRQTGHWRDSETLWSHAL